MHHATQTLWGEFNLVQILEENRTDRYKIHLKLLRGSGTRSSFQILKLNLLIASRKSRKN
jgi:hypothetical protein